MLSMLSYSIFSTMLGALLLYSVILTKAEICPGQRRRLYNNVKWIILGLCLSLPIFPIPSLIFGLISCLSLIACYIKTDKKNSVLNKKNLLYISTIFAFFSLLLLSTTISLKLLGILFCYVFVLGACFSHWILLKAKSRLVVIRQLLPYISILGMIVVTILLAIALSSQAEIAEQTIYLFIFSILLMFSGFVVWLYPIVIMKDVRQIHTLGALLLQLSASFMTIKLLI